MKAALNISGRNKMPNCVFYIDEAGSFNAHHIPLRNGETPIFTLAAVAFPLEDWRERDRELLALKRHFFPDRMSRTGRRDEHIEIKGKELTAARNARSSRYREFLRRSLSMINDRNGCCFGVSFLKNHITPISPDSLYNHALQILVERFDMYIAEHEYFKGGILICDSRSSGLHGKDNINVVKSHMSFIFGHETGRTLLNILESPLFADSRLCAGLQFADILASVLFTNNYQYHLNRDPERIIPGAVHYPHIAQYWPIAKSLEFKSKNGRMFGYRVIDHRP
jgi:hypothetical protein